MGMQMKDIVFIAIIGLWIGFSLLTNIGVLLVVILYKKMHTVTNLFICNLALSDIFLAAFVLPQHLHDLSHSDLYFEGGSVANILPE